MQETQEKNPVNKHENFDLISLSIASPEDILKWSHGEVKRAETVNYRTQKPERDGIFCEKIFGPKKNFECYCGKYKKAKHMAGQVCEKCGVEITRAIVRRERMAHVELAAPVTHIWFLKSPPSRIGLILGLSSKQLERVANFSSYLVSDVNEEKKQKAITKIRAEADEKEKEIKAEAEKKRAGIEKEIKDGGNEKKLNRELAKFEDAKAAEMEDEREHYADILRNLDRLKVGHIMTEEEYVYAKDDFGEAFKAGIGGDVIHAMLSRIDIDEEIAKTKSDADMNTGVKLKNIMRRLHLLVSMKRSGARPEWMTPTMIPILPPDLRPMVPLEGGRFAASDLNDYYRAVINRNNRLKRLMSINAPDVICKNEKRMLQEAVDELFNKSARAQRQTFSAADKRPKKSLSDILKGKQGRFRQNLLGKRVDYSGRSVIVANPRLHLHQCGLPKHMALELFRSMVVGELLRSTDSPNIKVAQKMVDEAKDKSVWDALGVAVKGKYVLLNRAPTLHKLGILAFQPLLVDGKAIQIHPLVCSGFNADFDGDQMAVHIPLSDAAQREARELMLSTKNFMKPSEGEVQTTPSQEIILGIYYLTSAFANRKGHGMAFSSVAGAKMAHELGKIDLQAEIKVKMDGDIIDTTVGRAILNEVLPRDFPYQNGTLKKKDISSLFNSVYDLDNDEQMAKFCDDIKDLGYKFATRSGSSLAVSDLHEPSGKKKLLAESDEKVDKIQIALRHGLITAEEKYNLTVNIWRKVVRELGADVKNHMQSNPENEFSVMIESGARGSYVNATAMGAMKGPVVSPSGKIIEVPIKSSFLEGFTSLEYFLGSHSGRKGRIDTALKTAQAGYLTRRFVDAVQNVIISKQSCGTEEYFEITRENCEETGTRFNDHLYSRTSVEDIKVDGEVVVKAGELFSRTMSVLVADSGIDNVKIRTIIGCESKVGVCAACYGLNLTDGKPVQIGTPVGIIAAQSIGEPGTQLTMRTFHSGGMAESAAADITQGLPRVNELFEARNPKGVAIIADATGVVKIKRDKKNIEVSLIAEELRTVTFRYAAGMTVKVKAGQKIEAKKTIARFAKEMGKGFVKTTIAGVVDKITDYEIVIRQEEPNVYVYDLPANAILKIKDGDYVNAGDQITDGTVHLSQLLDVTNVETVQRYIINEAQKVYASQGVTVLDKHFETIVRTMFSRVEIEDPGNTTFYAGEQVSVDNLEAANAKVERPATFRQMVLGITDASLASDSWMAAASFQQTVRVIIEAAVTGKPDYLQGLKENVIVGKLIPVGENYRDKQKLKAAMENEAAQAAA